MTLQCHLRTIRGRRPLRAIADAAGVNRGTLSLIERGRLLPTDTQVELLEPVYGADFDEWYPSVARRAMQPDEERPT